MELPLVERAQQESRGPIPEALPALVASQEEQEVHPALVASLAVQAVHLALVASQEEWGGQLAWGGWRALGGGLVVRVARQVVGGGRR